VYPNPARVQCLRVRVQCHPARPILYPCGTLEAGNQANWYHMFLEELGYDVCDPVPLHGDNTESVKLSLNPVIGRKSKHIPLRYHVIRDYIEKDQVKIIRIPGDEMLADGLTKSFAQIKLTDFISGLGLI
jgi:hypothetical protein